MGLIKEKNNTKYHRINSLNIITNKCIIINTISYTSREKRLEEIEYEESNHKDINGIAVYREYNNYELPYDEEMNIKKAYSYLKILDDFKDAEDDLD